MKFISHLLLLIAFSALAGAAWVAHRPVKLQDVVSEPPPKGAKSRDAMDELRQAAIKRSAILEISEADLNRHLAAVLAAEVREPASRWIKFDRVSLDLEPDIAHLTLAWDIGTHRSTATVDFRVARGAKAFRVEVVGGSYGHLQVPHGLLRPLLPVLESLHLAREPDVRALFPMNQVRLAKDKLVLDPRFL